MTTYITFGHIHTYHVNGQTIDKDCVVAFDTENEIFGLELAFALFGDKWCFSYQDKKPDMSFFPRGIIWIDNGCNNAEKEDEQETIYEKRGFANRLEYIEAVAEEYGLGVLEVNAVAELLGEGEDFDGLLSHCADQTGSSIIEVKK